MTSASNANQPTTPTASQTTRSTPIGSHSEGTSNEGDELLKHFRIGRIGKGAAATQMLNSLQRSMVLTSEKKLDSAYESYFKSLQLHARILQAARENGEGASGADRPDIELAGDVLRNQSERTRGKKKPLGVPRCPDSKRTNILLGKAANLDVVLSGAYATCDEG